MLILEYAQNKPFSKRCHVTFFFFKTKLIIDSFPNSEELILGRVGGVMSAILPQGLVMDQEMPLSKPN